MVRVGKNIDFPGRTIFPVRILIIFSSWVQFFLIYQPAVTSKTVFLYCDTDNRYVSTWCHIINRHLHSRPYMIINYNLPIKLLKWIKYIGYTTKAITRLFTYKLFKKKKLVYTLNILFHHVRCSYYIKVAKYTRTCHRFMTSVPVDPLDPPKVLIKT